MDKIKITGGAPLNGVIPISGAKNAALPLMIASLLTKETLTLENMPQLADVTQLERILGNHGVDFTISGKRATDTENSGRTVHFTASEIVDVTAPYELVSRMRASFWVFAPLLARMGECRVSLPGGCAIGTRPVDLLLMALEKLGANIEIENGYVVGMAKDGLVGAEIDFPKVTVGGTHTALMAASLARGTTVLRNAAREPEIVDLAECLIKMGARIGGAGTSTIEIEGVTSLTGARHAVMPDRIEAGTYAMAVAMTGGDVLLAGARADSLQAALDVLIESGATVSETNEGLRVYRNGVGISPVDVETAPFPAFPTDLQAQFMALMTRAKGTSRIRETIFENRFMHVQELARLGARIKLEGDTAIVTGADHLDGAQVMATDLRASVSLVIAALAARGETTINRVYHLDRGFERLEKKLSGCGAQIERVSGQG
ncbi:UDP-N-acetylglucosamine 1-carboxyvinyltransferase [Methylocystis sp. MJC1]|jgi:UDP-N-acetylglucosamine 1-carboxyvinyltransferase|uniref:UDP-N-acetylglucosamine 1-carboxyvinyltransferase n=1 Tax=Methylocystis sp. MJC1 TaxID=2654282 RepID=UPI0013EE20F9|nr:UDP-N-acetylglucosamine 1-carboxyvinyltransferase [Methylocystis sp. MJC1]KAF2990548.1 UDP-N-acetylglucosamine 1-carboxyvinyltransferase [Methylocystis sp. MJC1]MBU6525791.1 UDP-N-acetylglucosamine 1-carboxyvinyltransferase [Methylocystis sp. MJC1]UZX12258.1 UDP-N-acetylglucosamine 1-carboxyvinyltransferase [Methylocystis sp. MJC1]